MNRGLDRGSSRIGSTDKAIQESLETRAMRGGANGLSGAFEQSPSEQGEGALEAIGEFALSRTIELLSSTLVEIIDATSRSSREDIEVSSVHETQPPQAARVG